MKKVDLDDMIRLAFQHAHTVLIEFKQKSLIPAFSILKPDQTVAIVGTPWANDEEKKTMLLWMKQYLKDEGSIAYCVVGEAWLATYSQVELRNDFVMPSKSDRRIEVVIAVAADREGHKVMRAHEIIRNTDGAVIGFAEAQAPTSFTDMAGLFD
jgi:hypothetical protein